MLIKDGYNNRPSKIMLQKASSPRVAELWITFVSSRYKININDKEKEEITDLMMYVTLEELLDLKDEIRQVIEKIIN